MKVGIITVSDRAAAGEYEDAGGPALKEASLAYGWEVCAEAIVPDEIEQIREAVRSFSSRPRSRSTTTARLSRASCCCARAPTITGRRWRDRPMCC